MNIIWINKEYICKMQDDKGNIMRGNLNCLVAYCKNKNIKFNIIMLDYNVNVKNNEFEFKY